MTKQYGIITTVAAALFGLAGCGSSSGSGAASGSATNGVGTASHSITGKAIDGYLSGATVCLDLNADSVCDADEPTTVTDANGTFILEIGDYNATVLAGAELLVYGGIDIDTNSSFEGTLVAPFDANESEYIITPLSTLVASKVDSNGTIASAKAEVIASLGLEEGDLDKDPIAEGDAEMMEKALEFQKALELLAGAISGAYGSESNVSVDTNVTTDGNVSADNNATEDGNVSAPLGVAEAIAYLSDVLSPYFDGRQTTLLGVLDALDFSEMGYDETTLLRIEEAKLAIYSIAHRLDAHGVVTAAEIRAKIRKMGRDAEKFKDKAMRKIRDDDAVFEDGDLDGLDEEEVVEAESEESAEEDAVKTNNGKKPNADNPNKPENPGNSKK